MTQRIAARPGAQEPAGPFAGAGHPWLSGKRLRLLVIVAVLAGVGLGYFFAANDGASAIRAFFEKPQVCEIGPVVTLDPFIVNLAGTRGERYLKAVLSFELSSAKAADAIQPLHISIRDAVIAILSAMTLEEMEAPSAKEDLKQRIVARTNEIIGSPLIVRVYYQEFVMQ